LDDVSWLELSLDFWRSLAATARKHGLNAKEFLEGSVPVYDRWLSKSSARRVSPERRKQINAARSERMKQYWASKSPRKRKKMAKKAAEERWKKEKNEE
jgi:hypothetical protein